jgi:3-phosphoshikimate 1-carboxyvinyltransferase
VLQLSASRAKPGGAERDRTADLVNAIHALSQLSYSPISSSQSGLCRLGSRHLHLKLPLVLANARIDYAGNIVAFFLDLLQQTFVAFILADVFFFLEIFEICSLDTFNHGHSGARGFLFLGDFGFLFILVGDADDGLLLYGFELFSLGLLGFVLALFCILRRSRRNWRSSFRLTWAACSKQRLRLEGRIAFRALDGPLLEVVEARRAGGAKALGSEVRFGRSSHASSVSEGRAVCHVRAPLSKKFGNATRFLRAVTSSGEQGPILQPMPATLPVPLTAWRSGPLRGKAAVPGDKSISHRALILGALTVGETQISGLLEAADILNTAQAMRQFGAEVTRVSPGEWRVWGKGVAGWAQPEAPLDFGNSGTGARLVMGAMATAPISAAFTGDESLRKRPMERVLEPLTKFGATYEAQEGGLMPLTLRGTDRPICIDYEMMVASAQVKSALLLAALGAPGLTRITQRALTRDHTERMLRAFGAEISVEPLEKGGECIAVMGEVELHSAALSVPRDPSSAAFPLVAALIVPGSEVSIPGVLLNPRRIGLIETLLEMGADISIVNRREPSGEEIGDLIARYSELHGVHVLPERAPSMIDEYPILAIAAANASGRTVMRGLEELRVKESDRLSAIVNGLRACGVQVEELEDGLIIHGSCGEVPGGATIATHMDHRIAMSFLTAGLASAQAICVDDSSMISTSFPGFASLIRGLGGHIG